MCNIMCLNNKFYTIKTKVNLVHFCFYCDCNTVLLEDVLVVLFTELVG